MLDQVDFNAPGLTKEEYKSIHETLVESLIDLQQQAQKAGVGLVVLVEGWNGAGKGSRISDLIYHLDARATSVSVTPDIDLEEARLFEELDQGVSGYYPLMQEFWKALGSLGSITFFDSGWYTKITQSMLFTLFGKDLGKKTKIGKKNLEKMEGLMQKHLASAEEFECQLTNNGYVVLKLFLHLSKKEQKRRFAKFSKDPSTRWRVNKNNLLDAHNYNHAYELYDQLISSTNFDFAPWVLIDAEDKYRANLDIGAALVESLAAGLRRKKEAYTLADEFNRNTAGEDPQNKGYIGKRVSLDKVDLSLALPEAEYRKQLKYEQKRLRELELQMFLERIPLVVMFEGWDAAGKGGAIKRLAQALDARAYTIFPSPAPTPLEKAHPHLWRYWTRLPKAGHVGIYDRSWYGRVLVERVEGFATKDEWSRAYGEINAFEQDLLSWGAIFIKFWVEISQEEQLRRFHYRQDDPRKRWKITDEDWRNREKYPLYKEAVEDMLTLTSTKDAPWTILESENKYYSRVKALQVVNDALDARLR